MAISADTQRRLAVALSNQLCAVEVTDALNRAVEGSTLSNTTYNNTDGTGTLTAAAVVGGVITRTGETAAYTDTTPTAAALWSASTQIAGQAFVLQIKNMVGYSGTLSAASGITLSGQTVIPPYSVGTFLVTTTSSTAATIQGIAMSPLTRLPEAQTASYTSGTGTAAAGNMEGSAICVLTVSGQAAITLTTRTATQIIAGVPNWTIGQGYLLRIVNTNTGTLTTAGGTGVTMTSTVPANAVADYFVQYTAASTVVATQLSVTQRTSINTVGGVAAGYKIARGVATTASASDTVVSGLATVVVVVATPQADLSDDLCGVTATIGDQAGSPAAGSFLLKSWKPTTGGAAGNPTPVAATSFSKAINWIAIGT